MKKSPIQKEWDNLIKKEQQYIKKHKKEKYSIINDKLEKVIPSGLQSKLDSAFMKGFELVFEKGKTIIEKTYDKKTYETDYEVNEYATTIKKDRKSIRKFTAKAKTTSAKNLLISGVEGIVLGAVGVGIPDIPVFIGVLLKSIYEIALSYGFEYESEEERNFILQLIYTAMYYGNDFEELDAKMNKLIFKLNQGEAVSIKIDEQIKCAAKTLSSELLYMKFLQGIPIAGIIGGISDVTCLQTITEYAIIKYQKRFLIKKKYEDKQ